MADDLQVPSPRARTASGPAVRPLSGPKIRVSGKFFFSGDEKFFMKGVSYGPFAPDAAGDQYPDQETAAKDMAMIAALGANTLRTYHVPPRWLLDLAAAHGLRLMIGIPWAQHVAFLDSAETRRAALRAVSEGARACREHPAVLAYLVGNEVPPDIVRWHGPGRVSRFLEGLYLAVKDADPDTLASYANFPSTEYLETPFADFTAFNVYLHREEEFRRYLKHLHHLAPERPLVLAEAGIDSMRNGDAAQAEILSWQVREAFDLGAAGTVVFSWTDDWFTGGFAISNWAFGLVDAQRRPKPAYAAVARRYALPVPSLPDPPPRVSVVVCAYNAERTVEDCLVSLGKLRYPDYEVLLVNDGSTDATLEIARRHPHVKVLDVPHAGLSAARNAGLAAATGEIVAYTDADCFPDPDWLSYLVKPFRDGAQAAGGPNFPPPEKTLIPAVVAACPGGPTHVLLSDDMAEHVPGCNMAFRKTALEDVGGFDPVFWAAGDDVDICWRLQDRGVEIGFSPAAMVWHYRRNTVKAYLDQQRGYGKAEALLYLKSPERFHVFGQSRWLGRIYGGVRLLFLWDRPVVYHGKFGRALFQSLYTPPDSLLAWLPFTVEWYLCAAMLAVFWALTGSAGLLAAAAFLIPLGRSVLQAGRVPVERRFRGPRAFLLVTALTYLGPLARGLERMRWRMRGAAAAWRGAGGQAQAGREFRPWPLTHLAYWGEKSSKGRFLAAATGLLTRRGFFVSAGYGWSNWDIQVRRGIWSQVLVQIAEENHGGVKRLFRLRCAIWPGPAAWKVLGIWGAAAAAAAAHGMAWAAALSLLAASLAAARMVLEGGALRRAVEEALDGAAAHLGFTELKAP